MASDRSSRSLTDILRELDSVKQELAKTPRAQWGRRQDLRDEEAALRAELRTVGQGGVDDLSIEQLKRRIAVVERRIKDHYGLRMSHASGFQGAWGGGGIDPQWLHKWYRKMDRAADLEGMREELSELRGELDRLEGEAANRA